MGEGAGTPYPPDVREQGRRDGDMDDGEPATPGLLPARLRGLPGRALLARPFPRQHRGLLLSHRHSVERRRAYGRLPGRHQQLPESRAQQPRRRLRPQHAQALCVNPNTTAVFNSDFTVTGIMIQTASSCP